MRMNWNCFAVCVALAAGPVQAGAQSGPMPGPDFTNVANFKDAKKELLLTAADLAMLRKNLFVVTPGDDWQIYHVYGTNDYTNFPSLVTVNTVLQLYHVVFDSTLRHLEQHHLYPEAQRLAKLMLKQARTRYASLKGSKLASAALKNLAYFAVADRLLGGAEPIPSPAAAMAGAELASINAAQGLSSSAIFPYQIDYSQFIVRGHYGRSPELGRYFRAMMWFGLVPIALERRDGGKLTPLPEQVRQAALMVQDLYDGGALPAWQRIYECTSLYAGESNDLTPMQWRFAVKPVLGWPQNLGILAQDSRLAEVVAAVKQIAKPDAVQQIRERPVAGDVQLRLMGQRTIPDSLGLSRVVDPRERPWPSSLDIAAIFGSSRAATILDAHPAEYNPKPWTDYASRRADATQSVVRLPASAWTKNLYMGCLDLLRLNLHKPDPRAPRFMWTRAWEDKSISSSLAFWAELRHDTILYGAQSVAEQGDGEEPPFVKGYIEPDVPLYRRLLALLDQSKQSLAKLGFLSPEEAEQFKTFRDTVAFFLSVSIRELSGVKLSKDEHWRIRKIEGDLEAVNDQIQLIGETYNTLSEDDSDMSVVADVHTALRKALEVGTGHADDLIAVVPIEGKLYIARGSVLSYYEFAVPVNSRLTDHAWKQMVQKHKTPPRPPWIGSYFVNKASRKDE